ncbi:MAG: DUF2163 domain-containing protein [Sphingomonadales bacterium]|nr:DUF2163 domain-containing protein [Sphingomonadales bacterium]MBD3773783.1 DUF2163 domain-containing protein [Paracoccaceae bacterium]
MSRVFFREELEGVATFWRIHRRDGVTQGFTTHDRDLWFDGVLHRAAPGMLPSAIRRTADLSADSADVAGTLSHDSIAGADLSAGRYDGAVVQIGAVDWHNLDRAVLYNGAIGDVSASDAGFTAQLRSAKVEFEKDPVPRTSPTCRAEFCGPGCTLSPARFTREALSVACDGDANAAEFAGVDAAAMLDGIVRWIDGPQAGIAMRVVGDGPAGLLLDTPLDPATTPGMRALLREGCDHTFATCQARFGNGANFQGEPFLPGNDLLARYPVGA